MDGLRARRSGLMVVGFERFEALFELCNGQLVCRGDIKRYSPKSA